MSVFPPFTKWGKQTGPENTNKLFSREHILIMEKQRLKGKLGILKRVAVLLEKR